ncbi:MAG: lectin like domain-containing protein [Coriobacteriales bacterium]|nr:lectin like domain-containing protein [Coriobacteriales bacterium]
MNIAHSKPVLGEQAQSIVDGFELQAQHRVETGDKVAVNATTCEVVDDLVADANNLNTYSNAQLDETFPATFDLRNADLDGTGSTKNYVPSVKFQNPWGTCWAFAGIAASEISILTKKRQAAIVTGSDGNPHDAIDLSEHHLAWFNYTPMTAQENPAQAGEGAYSQAEANATGEFAKSQRMNTGGVNMSITSQFAMGISAINEPDFYDSNLDPLSKQLLYRGKNGTIQTRAKGDCYSAQDDWSIDTSQRFKQDYALLDGTHFPDIAKFDASGNLDLTHVQEITNIIKGYLMQGYAVSIGFCADNYSPGATNRYPRYINTTNSSSWAHYTYEKKQANHSVTIVGWDDNYATSNFLSEVVRLDASGNPVTDPGTGQPIMDPVAQPPLAGAWIIKNSWGGVDSIGQGLNKNQWGEDNKGYFHLSYYDKSLCDEEAYDFDVEKSVAEHGSIITQHDYMPCEQNRAISTADLCTSANVFTSSQSQTIAEIGAMTSEVNENVTYSLYRLQSATQRIDEGELLWSTNRTEQYAGFHRIALDQAYQFNKGEVFAITATQLTDTGYLVGVTADYNKAGYDANLTGDQYFVKGVVNPGESFVYTSSDDTWTDWVVLKQELETSTGESKYFSFDNFSLKAYGVPSPVDIAAATVTVEEPYILYDGQEHSPAVSVELNGIQLVEGEDYVLSGDVSMVDPGDYIATVEACGDSYYGSVNADWSIVENLAGAATDTGDRTILDFLFSLFTFN